VEPELHSRSLILGVFLLTDSFLGFSRPFVDNFLVTLNHSKIAMQNSFYHSIKIFNGIIFKNC